MTNLRYRPALAWVAAVGASAFVADVAAQQPEPLASADFVVARLSEGLDSTAVQERLGAPDSVTVIDHPHDVGGTLATWCYPHLLAAYGRTGRLVGVTLTDSTYTTHRGLRVGDTSNRVRELYGVPSPGAAGEWRYHAQDSHLHAVVITIAGDRVVSVFLGWLLD